MHNQVDRFQALLSDLLEISRFDAGSAVLNIDAEDFMSVLNDVLVEVSRIWNVPGPGLLCILSRHILILISIGFALNVFA